MHYHSKSSSQSHRQRGHRRRHRGTSKYKGGKKSNGSEGVIIQVVATGSVNDKMTLEPSYSPWIYKCRQTTNFVHEGVDMVQESGGKIECGKRVIFEQDTPCDMVYQAYVRFTLPALAVESRCDTTEKEGFGCFPILSDFVTADDDPDAVVQNNTLSARQGSKVGDAFAVWTNAIGFALIEEATWRCCGQDLDHVRGKYLYIWDELTADNGHRLGELVGRFETVDEQIDFASKRRVVYVPLDFAWCQFNTKAKEFDYGHAFPTIKVQYSKLKIDLLLTDLQYLAAVALPCDRADPFVKGPDGDQDPSNMPIKDDDGQVINDMDMQPVTPARINSRHFYRIVTRSDDHCNQGPLRKDSICVAIELESAYLDGDERELMADPASVLGGQPEDYDDTRLCIMHADQCRTYDCDEDINMRLNFNHPSLELLWTVQPTIWPAVGQYLTFRPLRPDTEIIEGSTLYLNGKERFEDCATYFRLQQPHLHHSNQPESHVYVYSFGLTPEDDTPDSSLNLSRIDNTNLHITLNDAGVDPPCLFVNDEESDAYGHVLVEVYDRFFNLVKYEGGMCGLVYSN